MQASPFHPLPNVRDRRFVRHGTEWERLGMRWLGLIESKRAMNPIKPLSPCVPRLEFVISKRPTSCRPVAVGDWRKILRAVSQKDRTVELRVAANIVIIAGIKGFALRRRSTFPVGGTRRAERSLEESRASAQSRSRAPRSRINMLAPLGASPAAHVAPPIPDPTISMSTDSTLVTAPANSPSR